MSPLPFKPEELVLDGDATAEEARRSLHNLQAFSTLVNLLPEGEAWVPDEAAYLWDV